MPATLIDKKRRTTLPEAVCQALDLKANDRVEWSVEGGELRGRKLVVEIHGSDPFPRGSLRRYQTAKRAKEQLAILSGCIMGPVPSK